MKHRYINAALATLLAIFLTPCLRAVADNLQADAQQTIANFKSTDPTLSAFFNNSAGYAVFPSISKGGLVVGGARGKGVVFQRGGAAIGEATMTQGTVGAQIGGQTFSQVIFFETPQALQNFKNSNWEMAAGVSAVAAAQGVGRTAKYTQNIAVFTMPIRGLMAAAAVGGQKFNFEPYPQPTGQPSGRRVYP